MKKFLKVKNILPLIHFILSFFYERMIFVFMQDNEFIATISKSSLISDTAERIMGYIFAKFFAAVFIILLWRLIFFVIENRKKIYVCAFAIITLIGCIIILLLWPDCFTISTDNYITYSYALRFWPEYWHSAYSSFIFSACMMVVPHPAFITVFQWIFASFTVGYLYHRIVISPVLKGKGRGIVFLIFAMPQIFTLLTNSYRTEIYALFCMLVMSITVMDLIDCKKADNKKLIGIFLMIGLLSVWRTEGIIIGVFLSAIWIFFTQKIKIPRGIAIWIVSLLIIVGFMIPQKLGDSKYYGKDYSFINSFPTLQNILNSPSSDLAYSGVNDDLAVIEKVVPISQIKLHGMDGYRRYNYSEGRRDINQSLASSEDSSAYMKAYYSLVLHNPKIYAKTQLIMLSNAIMLTKSPYIEYYYNSDENDLPEWHLDAWDIGIDDLENTYNTEQWENNPFRKSFAGGIEKFVNTVSGVLEKIHFYTLLLILIPLIQIFIFFRELVILIKHQKSIIGLAVLAFALLGQAFAIVLVMPANVLVYLHAYYYSSLIMIIGYFLYMKCTCIKEDTK